MELSAASRSHDGGAIETVNLSYPESKLVGYLGCHTGNGEVNMLEANTWSIVILLNLPHHGANRPTFVEMKVEVLVRIDPTNLLEAGGPGGAADNEVLIIAVTLVGRQQLGVHEVYSDLTDPGVTGDHSKVTSAGHIIMTGVVRIYKVDKLILALVATTVDTRHDLSASPPASSHRVVVRLHSVRNLQPRQAWLGFCQHQWRQGEEEREEDHLRPGLCRALTGAGREVEWWSRVGS